MVPTAAGLTASVPGHAARLTQQLADLAGDLKVFAGTDDQGLDRGPGGADVAIGLGGVVAGGVDGHPEEGHPFGRPIHPATAPDGAAASDTGA